MFRSVLGKTLGFVGYTVQGDIIIAKSPFDPNMNVCKRVIGLEGDKVCTSSPSDLFKAHTYVPKGHVWLEGDNLRNSSDSRSYGPIPYALIRGRVCIKLAHCDSAGQRQEAVPALLVQKGAHQADRPSGRHLKPLVIKKMKTGPPACSYPLTSSALGIAIRSLPTNST
ncbi:hypothetical protein F7725_026205 [Dissostichus mawsoni]|uniref:Peptidase S26 domain-containing protein n=1 Tax=Dissostichus mawsoni TaxID=36200 RepID=A0A7J5X6C4_DISMA|nr:hypothetical protein F7725_026205 [Dissostichus mawsoni]